MSKLLPPIPRATWLGLGTGLVLFAAFLVLFRPQITPGQHQEALAAYRHRSHSSRTSQPSPSASPSPSAASTPPATTAPGPTLAMFQAPTAAGLITNEYAMWNPRDSASVNAPAWEMTSGSLFSKNGNFWTGAPDSCVPNAKSTNCTDSNDFRLDTKQQFQGNLAVRIAVMQNGNIADPHCSANDTCWHGTHVWLRYQNQYNLYYASVNRADGQVVLKRKVPCGSDNDGTYFVLGSYVPHNFKSGTWNHYMVTIVTNPSGSVTLQLYDTDVSSTTPVTTGTDSGGTNPSWSSGCTTQGHYSSSHYTPITAAGGVGVRGDFSDFFFRDFQISQL